MLRRRVLVASVVIAAAALLIGPGCSNNKVDPPRAAVDAEVSVGAHSATECPDSTAGWFRLGSFVDDQSVEDGASFGQGTAGVDCLVTPQDNGFRVAAQATLSGAAGGAFIVQGFFKQDPQNQPNTGIHVSAARAGTAYVEDDCTAIFLDTDPLNQVVSGRIWATVTCPNATVVDIQRTCQTVTQFRFERCNQ
ncbi:MAG: hypothetical protein FWD69_16860 [Polyangiaceae bacterium]|nr:hypothetical protein [Polyangiaceae bacterium]